MNVNEDYSKYVISKDEVIKDGVKYNRGSMKFYELLSNIDSSVTMNINNETHVVTKEGKVYIFYIVYKIMGEKRNVIDFKKNIVSDEKLWRDINDVNRGVYLRNIMNKEVKQLNKSELDKLKSMFIKLFENIDGINSVNLVEYIFHNKQEVKLKEFIKEFTFKSIIMVNRNDNMKFTIEDISDMNSDSLKPDRLTINDKFEKMMSVKYREQEYNNFINDYYLQVHNLVKIRENIFETSVLVDFRFRCGNILDKNEIMEIDTLLNSFDNNKLTSLKQNLINKYKLESNYFDESFNNFINLNNIVFDVRILQDQFKCGNFINMYNGEKFEKEFINNILNKETINKKYIVIEEEEEETISSIMLKFEAYVNGIITEAQSNEFSKKFFVDEDEGEDENEDEGEGEDEGEVEGEGKRNRMDDDRSNYKENVVKESKVVKPDIVEVGKYKTFKYNKGRKVFEEIVYNSLRELDNDTNWPKPRITKENNIK